MKTNFSSAIISCIFVDGATGLGCCVSFASLPCVNLSRVNGSNIVSASVPFPEGLTGTVTVTVAEILGDGSVSVIGTETIVDIPLTTNPGVYDSVQLMLWSMR